MKRALVFLGDAWHAPHPLRNLFAEKLMLLQYDTTFVTDYTPISTNQIDFSQLHEFDLIVISRYALNDYKSYQNEHTQRVYWLSKEQELQLETFVLDGGSLLLHHDGIGFHPKESSICRLAKCFFQNHPEIISIRVEPQGYSTSLNAQISPYNIADEEFNMTLQESETTVFLKSFSEQNGWHAQGWCHPYGAGRVLVFAPGHDATVQRHPMVRQGLENALRWLTV